MIRKAIATFVTVGVVGLYTTFVLTVLWAWFVVPAFHVSPISFWVAYGLVLIVGLLRSPDDFGVEHRHNVLAAMVNACIPAEQRENVVEQLNELEDESWSKLGWMIFGQVAGNTLTLGIGFLAHVLASL